MLSGSKKKNKNGPESAFLDTLKGKQIGIVFGGRDEVAIAAPTRFLRCKLLWVDRYSYGIELGGRGVEMVMKHAVARLFLVEGTGHELV